MVTVKPLVITAAALITLGCGDPTGPDDDPVSIVFAYTPANDITLIDLYVMSESGRVRRPLIVREGIESHPAWSPDGSRVAFTSKPFGAGSSEIFVVRADGTGLTRVTSSPTESRGPVWSPDGSRIAFVQLNPSSSRLAIVNSDGSGLTTIPGTDGAHFHTRPSWSPDGARLAFGRRQGVTSAIWVVAPDGSGLTRLTSGACGDSDPAWSPDGAKLAFRACDTSTDGGIVVTDADGSNARRLTSNRDDGLPSWSPDGRRILFARWGDTFDLHVVDIEGGQIMNLTDTPFPQIELEPHWRPNR
jgi:TolB protein